MDIAGSATIMKLTEVRQEAGMKLHNQVQDIAELQGEKMIEMLEDAGSVGQQQSGGASQNHPFLGQSLDIRT